LDARLSGIQRHQRAWLLGWTAPDGIAVPE
jgi:hypothetical protein